VVVRVQGLGGLQTHGVVVAGQVCEEYDWEVEDVKGWKGGREGRRECVLSVVEVVRVCLWVGGAGHRGREEGRGK